MTANMTQLSKANVLIAIAAFVMGHGVVCAQTLTPSKSEIDVSTSDTLIQKPAVTHPVSGAIVSQVGYVTGWRQYFGWIGALPKDGITLVNLNNGKTVSQWATAASAIDADSDLLVAMFPIGPLPAGHYALRAKGYPEQVFDVSAHALAMPLRSLLRAYYLQRCNIVLDDTETGLHHDLDHDEDAKLAHADAFHDADVEIDTRGGWHDAGDFGKYVATTSVTVGQLLAAYLDSPEDFPPAQLNIPESENGIPDILNETRVGLDWMLSVQRADGALYRKVSGAKWPDPMPPDQDTQTRYIYGVSSADTAKAAAAFALAARVYHEIDPSQAARYRQAAERAWQWLRTAPPPLFIDLHPGDDSGSGPYRYTRIDHDVSLKSDIDDRIWAASELWLTTGDPVYLTFVDKHTAELSTLAPFEWKNGASMGLLHLLDAPADHALPAALRTRIAHALRQAAQSAYHTTTQSGFALANRRFVWGSNKLSAEYGVLLASAYLQGGPRTYLDAAVAQLDFLFGVNPFGLSFVSGVGEHAVEHPAHLYGRAVNHLIPGLLVGGPNDLAQDHIAPAGRQLLSYVDDVRAYSVNEFAIDYNAALIGLISIVQRAYRTPVLNKRSPP